MHSALLTIMVSSTFVGLFYSIVSNSELYTSVEEAAIWPRALRQFSHLLDKIIELEDHKLAKLKDLRKSLELYPKSNGLSGYDDTTLMRNPIQAFITLSRLRQATLLVHNWYELINNIDTVNHFEHDTLGLLISYKYPENLLNLFEQIKDSPSLSEDLIGSGEALLRLQDFYDLNIENIIDGQVLTKNGQRSSNSSIEMNLWDCFELGKVAYNEERYGLAIQWLFKSLEMALDERSVLVSNADTGNKNAERSSEFEFTLLDSLVDDILDHMAFSAYKLDMVDYAASLTEAWLKRDPDNERARDNLDFYKEQLVNQGDAKHQTTKESCRAQTLRDLTRGRDLQDQEIAKNESYLPLKCHYFIRRNSQDHIHKELTKIVRNLCTHPKQGNLEHVNVCHEGSVITADGKLYPGLKIETLYEDPKIIRIYDIITEHEANLLKELALPHLARATVNTHSGHHTSDHRIAKTAWLQSNQHHVVSQIEDRLGSVLNISMTLAEHLQVVNYGLGGFYGPHMDSSRPSLTESKISQSIEELQHRDRLATILIYLNSVDAGGSTVFPRLNLTVQPIEYSAVVWYNIRTDGFSDERTIHSGCPVLQGSKWIATKWPCEQANVFMRPCRLIEDSRTLEVKI